MDKMTYWLNRHKKRAGEGKCYYFYRYTRCEDDGTPVFVFGGKEYVRIEVSDAEWEMLTAEDRAEYNNERRVHNKAWTTDVPRLREEDGETDFWTDFAEDGDTRYIESDICEEMDRKAAVRRLPPLERRIYLADRKGYTQGEIAEMTGLAQSTVSRKLEGIYEYMDAVRLHDGDRTVRELAFEIGWESFLRNGTMKNDADARAFLLLLSVGKDFLMTLYKWYCSPRELLRYSVRYLMVGGEETKEELLAQVSEPGKEFFRKRFDDKPEWLQKLCLRIMRELERRVVTMPEPSGNVFHGMEGEIEKLARRRKMTYAFYMNEILYRRYKLRRNRWTLTWVRRIAAKTKDKTVKTAMRREEILLVEERKALQKELKEILQGHREKLGKP